MSDNLRAVILDIDGTLIDSVDGHARAWQEVFKQYGAEVPFEEVRKLIGKGGDQFMPQFLPADVVRDKADEIEALRLKIFQTHHLPSVRAFPQSRELVQRIKREGLRVVLASSAKADELKGYTKLARIDDLLDDMTSADDAERSKPHPDIFEAALKKLEGVTADQAIAVGDTPWDAEAAGKAGLRTVGVLCGGGDEQTLREAGCVAIYQDPADLLARFESSPLARR